MKKVSILLALLLMVTYALGGCATGGAPSGSAPAQSPAAQSPAAGSSAPAEPGGAATDVPTVRAWIKKSFSTEADDELVARLEGFGTGTGKCDVTVEMVPNANFGEKYSAAVESGDVPDVAFMTLYLLRQYYDAGLLLELDDLVADIEADGHPLVQKAKDAVTFDGNIYAVPYYLSSTGMYYRKDYLEQAGWTEPPATWEEVRQCAIDVTEKVPDVYGLGFSYGKCPDTENAGRSALFSLGGQIFNQEGNPDMSGQATQDALKWICDLYAVDKCVPPTAISWDDAGNNTAFLSGQVAMIFNASSITMELMKDENKQFAENVGIANMPAGPQGNLVVSGPQYLAIFKNAKNVELAKEIIKYNMEYDWYKGWADTMRYGIQPAYTEITYDDPYIEPFVRANEQLVWQGYPGPYTGLAARTWSAFELANFFQRVLVDNVSVEQASAEMMSAIEELR